VLKIKVVKLARIFEILSGNAVYKAMNIFNIWRFKITDLRKDKTFNEPYIIIANHVSIVDSLFVYLLPIEKKFMIAKIFTKIPLFGFLCDKFGYVAVDMYDRSTTVDAVDRSLISMKDNCNFVIFPEGRRELVPYKLEKIKTGAFRLSLFTDKKILPICLKGTNKAMKRGGLCSMAFVEMVIGEPFQVREKGKIQDHVDDFKKFLNTHLD